MKNKRVVLLLLGLLLISAMVSACAAPVAPAAPAGGEEAAATEAAPAEAAADDAAAKPYIPVISKGFQHQFWQAVKLGSEQAAADLNVDITFEG
ncbi:MAG: hypothetical protein KDD91_16920, partial [Caldilinea sp.]|nr:hypothetical protein [Caldilinea sp.]